MKTRQVSSAAATPTSKEAPSGVRSEEKAHHAEEAHILEWVPGAVLIACIQDRATDGSTSPDGRLLFISPTTGNFDELTKQSPFISELWILAASGAKERVSYIERITQVASWTASTPGGRPLLVLRGQSGQLLGVDEDGIFAFQSSSIHWSGAGVYQSAPTAASTPNDCAHQDH